MKNLILILIPLLFLGCKKDDLPIEVSEGTRITKIAYYFSSNPDGEIPAKTIKFYYDENGRLFERHKNKSDESTIWVERFSYNDNGRLILQKNGRLIDGERNFGVRYTPFYDIGSDLMKGYTVHLTPNDGSGLIKRQKHHFTYDHQNQLIKDSIVYSDDYYHPLDFSEFFSEIFKYVWQDGNIVEAYEYNIYGKRIGARLFKYDSMNNYGRDLTILPLSHMWDMPYGMSNNWTAFKGSFHVISTCAPCERVYKYNSSGFPYLSRKNKGGGVTLYFYE
ncbi:MAG: hypothetical protein EA362_08170 [Saprospirales bacterium]|nr:MAG: hypothetical protein EA362_08170 [Saprospirales bacterium]